MASVKVTTTVSPGLSCLMNSFACGVSTVIMRTRPSAPLNATWLVLVSTAVIVTGTLVVFEALADGF